MPHYIADNRMVGGKWVAAAYFHRSAQLVGLQENVQTSYAYEFLPRRMILSWPDASPTVWHDGTLNVLNKTMP